VSLNVPDESALQALRQRLLKHDCEVTEVVNHGLIRSIYFTDPNGIALEAFWWVDNPTDRVPTFDEARYGDAHPVPTVQELLATGKLSKLPATKLIDQPSGDVYQLVRA
jgi:catechol-2,3-dioxygenase